MGPIFDSFSKNFNNLGVENFEKLPLYEVSSLSNI